MTAYFIILYMEYLIDLLILLLYISYLFQPLDVGVFILLKHTLAEKTDIISRFDYNRILYAD